MSFMGNLLGIGGNTGMGWKASGTNIAQPTTAGQADTAYQQTQKGLQGQEAFLQALQAQGGLGNQASVFGQQQNLANMMQGVAAGTGPNPALAQLNQTTGQNIAGTTAALAGARGAGSNPALAARSAARLGAETQQQAAGQAATLAAQQQIAGMDALSRQQQQMASMANQQVANQAAATNAYSTAAQQQQQNLLASINAQNQANVAMQSNINNANAGIQGITAQGQQGLLGGLIGGTGAALQLPGLSGAGKLVAGVGATGGRVKHGQIGNNPRAYADGGNVEPVQRTNIPKIDAESSYKTEESAPASSGAAAIQKGLTQLGSGIGSHLRGNPNKLGPKEVLPASSATDMPVPNPAGQPQIGVPEVPVQMRAAKGGKVPALLSPGEKYLTPEQAQDVLKGKENPLNGKTIPGKAVKKGDSYDNDVVPATLEEGGCVIPRSVLQSDQPMKNAIKFVHEHMKKMAKGGKVEKKQEQKQVEQKAEQHETVPVEVAHSVVNQPHVLFSPANALFPKELDMTPDEVLELVKSEGLIAEPAIGKYGEVEPSIMVHNVQDHHIPFLFELARKLGQESAIYSKGGRHEAHILNGPNAGKIARGMGTIIHEKEPENFYTKTKNGLIFAHDIDFDNLHDK